MHKTTNDLVAHRLDAAAAFLGHYLGAPAYGGVARELHEAAQAACVFLRQQFQAGEPLGGDVDVNTELLAEIRKSLGCKSKKADEPLVRE